MDPLTMAAITQVALSAGSTAYGMFGKKDEVKQQPLETAEQTSARQMLYNMARSDLTYKGALGNYDMTDLEKEGMNKLMQLLQSGDPAMMQLANKELTKFYSDAYDPFSEKSVYAPFKAGVERELKDNMSKLRQNQSIRGNLYSNSAIKQERELYDIGQEKLTGKMAELYDTMVGRRAALIPSVLSAAQTGEDITQKRIAASQIYGALPRTLADREAKDKYNEYVREINRRQGAYGSILGTPTNFGVSSVPLENPWSNLMNNLAMYGSMYAMYNSGSGKASYIPEKPRANVIESN